MDQSNLINNLICLVNNGSHKNIGNRIKKQNDLYLWLVNETKHVQDCVSLTERAYLVLNSHNSNVCNISNKTKRFVSFSKGYAFCGSAKDCSCAKASISQKLKTKQLQKTPEQKQQIQQKRKTTTLLKYQVENVGQLDQTKKNHREFYSNLHLVDQQTQKYKQRFFEKHGVDNPQKLDDIKQKTKLTMLEKYGVDNISKLESRKKSIGQTSKKNWEFRKQSNFDYMKIKEKFVNVCNVIMQTDSNNYRGVVNQQKYQFECLACGHNFSTYISNGHLPICKKCFPTKYNFKSKQENQIVEFLKQQGIDIEQRNRTIIYPFELDIVCHSKKIAVEYCGLYWHSELSGKKSKSYHLDKMLACEKKGYRLITIFSDEWNNKRRIVENKLKSIFGIVQNEKIGARKCVVESVNSHQAKQFYENNHLQGHTPCIINLGLFFENELVACMGFGPARRITNNQSTLDEYELIRFASNCHIPGGAGKLLKSFELTHKPKRVFSYADRRYSQGNLYKKLGFVQEITKNNRPSYWYTNNYAQRYHRFGYTKASLVKLGMNKDQTEWELMQILGYDRIWDCGQVKFSKTYS